MHASQLLHAPGSHVAGRGNQRRLRGLDLLGREHRPGPQVEAYQVAIVGNRASWIACSSRSADWPRMAAHTSAARLLGGRGQAVHLLYELRERQLPPRVARLALCGSVLQQQ